MKVQCENCKTTLSLADDKIEPGAEFAFTCPKCKHKNVVMAPAAGGAPEFDDDDAGLGEFFEEGAKPVLICFDDGPLQDKLASMSKKLNFSPVIPKSPRDALSRLRLTQFNMILLDSTYAGMSLEKNSVLAFLHEMDMTVRRRIYVVLFGKELRTMDHMAAFALSVNAVLGLEDEEQFGAVLKRGLSEYERFYKVYFDVMREMGKA